MPRWKCSPAACGATRRMVRSRPAIRCWESSFTRDEAFEGESPEVFLTLFDEMTCPISDPYMYARTARPESRSGPKPSRRQAGVRGADTDSTFPRHWGQTHVLN